MTNVTPRNYTPWARAARVLTLLGLALLLLCIALTTLLWPGQGREPSAVIWILQSLPLLVFVPALLRRKLRGHIWLCFVLLLYFAASVVRLFEPAADWLAWLELAAIVTAFCAAMLFVRWRARALRQSAEYQARENSRPESQPPPQSPAEESHG